MISFIRNVQNRQIHRGTKKIVFLGEPHGMWDSSFPIKSMPPCIISMESQTLDCQRSPKKIVFYGNGCLRPVERTGGNGRGVHRGMMKMF